MPDGVRHENLEDESRRRNNDTVVEEGDSPDAHSVPSNDYLVSSYGWSANAEELVARINSGAIYLPTLQRRAVWSLPIKSRFIETLILGLPVPNLILAEDPATGNLNVVDGQQRLGTLREYLGGEFRLEGAEIQDEFKGCYFSRQVAKSKKSKTLSYMDLTKLSNMYIHSIVIAPDPGFAGPNPGHEYDQAVIQMYRRLNFGGKALHGQEIRASIFRGSLDNLIRELNEDATWRELFGKPHALLKDMEMILRFLALRQEHSEYRSPMQRFLDKFMAENRQISAERLEEFANAFRMTIALVKSAIGKKGFRNGRKLKACRFDAIMCGVDAYIGKSKSPSKEDVLSRLERLQSNERYKWSIDEHVNETDRVKKRVELALDIFGA